jgi:hypothetical protein
MSWTTVMMDPLRDLRTGAAAVQCVGVVYGPNSFFSTPLVLLTKS